MWAQRNVVSEDGYAALAATAAKDPRLQQAMASELTTQIIDVGRRATGTTSTPSSFAA